MFALRRSPTGIASLAPFYRFSTTASAATSRFVATPLIAGSSIVPTHTTSLVLRRKSSTEATPEPQIYQPKKGNRPISPHVTIYKFPLPALASITHRMTGVALTGITYTLGFIACIDPVLASQTMSSIGAVPILALAAKSAVTFAFSYHFFQGLRHLYWDFSGEDLGLDDVQKRSWMVIGASVAAVGWFVLLS
eukprot:TRINITY_DN1912_c0_g1_i2.p1 TRINITY_DN1912_c0_g1~~TRINITY_DN1912_c0_g1_i2.p1  ORF type:complete len:193 (-),score=37.99 TRINITY_DN1912_c0_g1_i2:711-1289(-)